MASTATSPEVAVQVIVSMNGRVLAYGVAEGPGENTVDLFIRAVNLAQEDLIARNTHPLRDDDDADH